MKSDEEIALEYRSAPNADPAKCHWTLEDVLAALAAARADERKDAQQLAEARNDAERYRWLKRKFYAVGSPPVYWNCRDFEPGEDSALVGDTLNAAIDAALEDKPCTERAQKNSK